MKHDALDLAPVRHAGGTLRIPGSKSVSNRALLLAALAQGTTQLRGLLESDDTHVMLEALRALGVAVSQGTTPDHWSVTGLGPAPGFPAKRADLFLGNAGTAFRPLTAALALADGHYRVAGVPRMHERPIGDLVDALRQAGGEIAYEGIPGFPPLAIGPRAAATGEARVRVRGDVSSQYLSALLLALPWQGRAGHVAVDGELISKPYVALTLTLLERFGVTVEPDRWEAFRIPAGPGYRSPGTFEIEGDASTASYFLAAGALGGGPVRVEGVGRASLQGDVEFAEVLRAMGADVDVGADWMEASGRRPLLPFDLDLNRIPDAAMTAAVLALFAEGTSRIRNIASWRVKETDRIAAMAAELRKLGAAVEEGADFIVITPPAGFATASPVARPPVPIATYDDHRMAMCFSLAAFGPVPVRILNPGCVSKTFPGYFAAFARLAA